MEYIVGALITTVFFLCLGFAFYCGKRFKNKTIDELDEQQKFEIQKKIEGMQNIMNYDIETAMGVKHEHQ